MKKINTFFLFFCIFTLQGFPQSFVKIYTDINPPYLNYGINVVPAGNKETVVLGEELAFTRLVDSIGNKEYTETNYPSFVGQQSSNLTADGNGFVFFNAFGPSNMGNPNPQSLIFLNDTLGTDTINYFYSGVYAYTDNINLYSEPNKQMYFTCTCWTHGIGSPYKSYSKTFVSRYDSMGRRIWSFGFTSSDTDQVFYSTPTTDSGIAVVGEISDTTQLKKYDLNGNALFNYRYSLLVYRVDPITGNFNCRLQVVHNNILAFGDTIDASTGKIQLALEIITLHDSLIARKKFVLNTDTANILPLDVAVLTDSTAILHYSIYNSNLNYYMILDYKGDSLSSFTLPASAAQVFDNGNVLCASDTNDQILVREYNSQAKLIYKYLYQPFDSLNICIDIKPLPYPGRFVLTGSSDNNLLIIRQDTSVYNLGINTITNPNNISVFPNPTTGQFTIQLSGTTVVASVEIYNVLDKKVYSKSCQPLANSYKLNLSSQPNGIYLYRVITPDGTLIGEGKLVIER